MCLESEVVGRILHRTHRENTSEQLPVTTIQARRAKPEAVEPVEGAEAQTEQQPNPCGFDGLSTKPELADAKTHRNPNPPNPMAMSEVQPRYIVQQRK